MRAGDRDTTLPKERTGAVADRRTFWSRNQPGFRFTSAEPGTDEFYRAVEEHRYSLEPSTVEMARFDEWRDKDVLEVGCGMATDGASFAHAGAHYTGVDFSATALELARTRFARRGLAGRFVEASATDLPFPDESFDLIYSCGVIHHIPDTQGAISEMQRVLRPSGRVIAMVYHRNSFNYYVTIMAIRRLLAVSLLLPGVPLLLARLTGESPEFLEDHRTLLRDHGFRYLRDRRLFLNHNTDGPGNPLSKVYGVKEITRMFNTAGFPWVTTSVRYLNLRIYPGGQRLAQTSLARRLGQHFGWHLWVEARKSIATDPRDSAK